MDQIGRISQVGTTLNGTPKTLAQVITYLPYGGITGLIYGNGLSLTQGYDNQYRISSILTGSILNLTYGYDANGNIVSETGLTYVYDLSNQLIRVLAGSN